MPVIYPKKTLIKKGIYQMNEKYKENKNYPEFFIVMIQSLCVNKNIYIIPELLSALYPLLENKDLSHHKQSFSPN